MKKPLIALTIFLIILSAYGTAGYAQETKDTGSLKLIYSGYVLIGERLKLETPKEVITVTVKDVTSDSLILRIVSINVSTDLTVTVGEFKEVPQIHTAFSLKSTNAPDGVAYLDIYSQNGVIVNPPKNPSRVRVHLKATDYETLVGGEIPVTVQIDNTGPGRVGNLSVSVLPVRGLKVAEVAGKTTLEELPGYSSASPVVFLLVPTAPGQFNVSVRVNYYNESSSKVTVLSEPITIKAYSAPDLTVSIGATNSSSSTTPQKYVVSKKDSYAYVFITVSAKEGNPNFEFAKNVSVELKYPDGVTGVERVYFGTIKAGQSEDKAVKIKVNGENVYTIGAVLHYLDPLGKAHNVNLGTVVVVDSLPPRIVVKKVPVIPTEDQAPQVIKDTLENSKDPKNLAERIYNVISPYLGKEQTIKYLKASLAVLILITLILAYLAVGYYREVKTFRRLLLRKKKYKTGGLPRKWSRDELEGLIRELRMDVVRENLPPEKERR